MMRLGCCTGPMLVTSVHPAPVWPLSLAGVLFLTSTVHHCAYGSAFRQDKSCQQKSRNGCTALWCPPLRLI